MPPSTTSQFLLLVSIARVTVSMPAMSFDLVFESEKWNVPLFLWARKGSVSTTRDVVLLPDAPSKYSANAANYSLVYPDPVAYAYDLQGQPPSYPFVSLRLYYSEERSDFQTTTATLGTLNGHGGSYAAVANLGVALATTPGSGFSASHFVPLTVSYDDTATDAATAPLNYADINLLLNTTFEGTSDKLAYRLGSIAGFAARGTCSVCNMSMSETYPSAGGPDCAYGCNLYGMGSSGGGGQWDEASCLITTFDISALTSPAAQALQSNMRIADTVILKFGKENVTVTPLSRDTSIHISFNYFCCYSDADKDTIKKVLAAHDWPLMNVSYDQPTWRIDSDASDVDHYSIIILLDDASQEVMHAEVAKVEEEVRAAGIDIHVPRSQQEPFHSTLGVVSGSKFPAIAALDALSVEVPRGTWTGDKGPISISKPGGF